MFELQPASRARQAPPLVLEPPEELADVPLVVPVPPVLLEPPEELADVPLVVPVPVPPLVLEPPEELADVPLVVPVPPLVLEPPEELADVLLVVPVPPVLLLALEVALPDVDAEVVALALVVVTVAPKVLAAEEPDPELVPAAEVVPVAPLVLQAATTRRLRTPVRIPASLRGSLNATDGTEYVCDGSKFVKWAVTGPAVGRLDIVDSRLASGERRWQLQQRSGLALPAAEDALAPLCQDEACLVSRAGLFATAQAPLVADERCLSCVFRPL